MAPSLWYRHTIRHISADAVILSPHKVPLLSPHKVRLAGGGPAIIPPDGPGSIQYRISGVEVSPGRWAYDGDNPPTVYDSIVENYTWLAGDPYTAGYVGYWGVCADGSSAAGFWAACAALLQAPPNTWTSAYRSVVKSFAVDISGEKSTTEDYVITSDVPGANPQGYGGIDSIWLGWGDRVNGYAKTGWCLVQPGVLGIGAGQACIIPGSTYASPVPYAIGRFRSTVFGPWGLGYPYPYLERYDFVSQGYLSFSNPNTPILLNVPGPGTAALPLAGWQIATPSGYTDDQWASLSKQALTVDCCFCEIGKTWSAFCGSAGIQPGAWLLNRLGTISYAPAITPL